MNRTKNADFNKLQSNVRLGIWDIETATAFKSREFAALSSYEALSGDDHHPEDDYCPVLVTKNRTRANLEFARLRAISNSAKSKDELPIVLFGHFRTKRGACALLPAEKTYMRGLPDSDFNKAAPYLAFYPGARYMITANLNVACGIGQGTRCRVLGYPEFPLGTSFKVIIFNNVRVRVPNADPLFVLVELTSSRLLAIPRGQPSNLPLNVVALPMHLHKKACVPLTGLPDSSRKSVTVRVFQIPLRPANALTSYAVQSGQFRQLIIYETTPTEFYTQISRCSSGLSSISLARALLPRFKPAFRESSMEEVTRLKALHILTEHNFTAETSALSNRVSEASFPVSGLELSLTVIPPPPRAPLLSPPMPPPTPPPPTRPPRTSSQPGTFGLLNLGSTCYLNTSVQSLLSLPAFRDFVLSSDFDDAIRRANHLSGDNLLKYVTT